MTLLSGDLRQILPVIRHGNEAEVIPLHSLPLTDPAPSPILPSLEHQIAPPLSSSSQVLAATLNRSELWEEIKRRRLTINHRVEQQVNRVIPGETEKQRQKRVAAIREWGRWVLSVGEGEVENPVHIPPHIHMPGNDLEDLIKWVYPDVASLTDTDTLRSRALLALRNETIDRINRIITERVPIASDSDQKIYNSTD